MKEHVKTLNEEALELHLQNHGKLEVVSKVSLKDKKDLSLAYTPGVASVCLKIKENPEEVYNYTSKRNMVGVVTDGSAVLGLGNIGPLAGLPVMEGKSILMKQFAGLDSFPICLDTQNVEEIIKCVKYMAPSFAAINLEDISAPRCVEIERRLINELNIPVFHDDQHGTAIVVASAVINCCRLMKKEYKDLTVVLSGTGAAGSSIARQLKKLGVGKLYAYNINGVVDINKYDSYDFLIKELLDDKIIDTPTSHDNTLKSIIKGANIFVGVSAANLVTKEMVKSMADKPIIFAMANPNPEITYNDAKEAGAYIIGTGRSDYPNQVNNVLAFPGIFKGAIEAKATKINEDMKLAASFAISSIITDDELNPEYIIPSAFDERVVQKVSEEVKKAAIKCGVVRK